jgi:EAL domain-containing protein (putative c-di-GMP-specific phosphodiesterase class I)
VRDLGVRVAIDDFGTGYSSFAALRSFPVSHVKIDKGFVAGLERNAHDRAIVEANVGLARAFDLTVTAEGVETTGQLDLLGELACDRVQGYLLARPAPADELEHRFGPVITSRWDAATRSWADVASPTG